MIAVSGAARAQDSDADAERLFREAQKLLEERRYGEACPKFEAAYSKDKKLGTLLNLAFCHKEQGSLWYAWLEFREAEFKAEEQKRPERKDFARKRLDELEKGLAKVIVDNPQKLPLTEVDVEDRRVPEAERGAYFTAEEGKRKLTFKAKGKKPATALVSIVRGDKAQHVIVPDMEDAAAATPEPTPTPEHVEPPAQKHEEPAADANVGGTQRSLGYVALAVGAGGVVVGLAAGVMTFTNPCGSWGSGTCTQSEKSRSDTTSLVANVGIGAGVAFGIAGVVLLVTAPSASTPEHAGVAPVVGPGYAGVRGNFW